MRYLDIFERRSTSMKSKYLQTASVNRTFGFEAEVFNETATIDKNFIEEERRELKSNHPLDEYFEEEILSQVEENVISLLEDSNGAEPLYGMDNDGSNLVFYDSDGDEHVVGELSFEEFLEFFDKESAKSIKGVLLDKRDNYIEYELNDILEREREENQDKAIEQIANIVAMELKTNVEIGAEDDKHIDNDRWVVANEQHKNQNKIMGEIISPVFNDIENGIKYLRKILSIIENEDYLKTGKSTGLHINIGVNKNIDILKFMLFIGEQDILKYFGREKNEATQSLLAELYSILKSEKINLHSLEETLDKINAMLDTRINAMKFKFLNIEPLIDGEGFIEIRGIGNKGYEKKVDKIIEYVRKISYVLDIAEDPERERDVYIKKLSKVINEDNFMKNEITKIDPFSQKETREFVELLTPYYNSSDDAYGILMATKMDTSYIRSLLIDLDDSEESLNKRLLQYIYRFLLYFLESNLDFHSEDLDYILRLLGNHDLRKLIEDKILPKYVDNPEEE